MSDVAEPGMRPAGSARRRYLTILFSDLSDSTKLASSMEAEQYADLLGGLREAYQNAVVKHGGTIVRVQGDGMLAIFGYPDASEDDGRRATEAALDLHEMVRGQPVGAATPAAYSLSLHTGIHSGLVLVNEGDQVRGRFELLGNAPNIAARLSDAANPDEILVSEETLGPASSFFQTDAPYPVSLKGRPEPIAVYRVRARARASVGTRLEARARRGLAPFVGRQAELLLLQDALDDTLAGRPRYLAVSAAAGVGKTRLIEEFLRRAASLDCEIYRGYCESVSAEPLQPFLQMLRSLFRLDHGASATIAADSVDATLAGIDPALLAHRTEFLRALSLGEVEPGARDAKRPPAEATIAALRELFASLAARKPLIVFVDDWERADDATSQVLNAVRALDGARLFLLIATRGFAAGEASMAGAQVLELAPFTEDEAAATIGQLLPHTDPFVAAEIRRYSGGNPLFIEELCHSAAHEDTVRRLGRMHGGAAWLNVLIESRVARLPEAQAELVRAAAVIGTVVPSRLLHTITGCGEDHPLVRELARQDFIFPGDLAGTLRFKHGIARDVIYDSVGLHQRRAMHLRVAEALRQRSASGAPEEAFEALAYHYGAGGHHAEAARFAELAGDKAVAASALDRAKSQYRAALAALDELEPSRERHRRWVAIAQRLGRASVFDPSRDELEVFRRAVDLATASGDQAAIVGAQYWLGYVSYALGESRAALHHCGLALAAAHGVGDNPLEVQIRATLGQARAAACDYGEALALLDEAIAVKRSHRSGARPAVGFAYSLACKAYVLGDRGQFDQAQACFAEALEAVHGADHEVEASIRGWRSAVLMWQGRWEEARSSAIEASRIGEQVRSLFSFSMARAAAGYASWMIDRKSESLQLILDATSWLEHREGGLFRSLNHGWLADGLVASGRIREARHHAARALLRARTRDLIGVAMAYRALARAAAGSNDGLRAQRYLALAMQTARARDSAHEVAVTQLCAAEIELAGGDRARAARLLDEAAAAFEAMGMTWHGAEAARVQGTLGAHA